MSTGFRLTASDGDVIGEADTIRGIAKLANAVPPGRYRIEEFSLDPATGQPQSREWGTLKKQRMLGLKRPPSTPNEFMEARIEPHRRPGVRPWAHEDPAGS
jgi:hypothetical protein